MGPHAHAAGRLGRRQACADGKAVTQGLCHAHDVRRGVLGPFVREKATGAAEATLNLVIDQQNAPLIAKLAQRGEADLGEGAGAALTLNRLDDHGRGCGADGRVQGRVVAEGQADIARQGGAKTFDIGRVASRIDRRIAAPVKSAFEADDVDPLRIAPGPVIFAGHFQGALHRLGAGIGEENHIGEGGGAEARGQFLLAGNAEDIRDVPELLSLRLQGRHQLRVSMAQARGGDARHAIQIGFALGRVETRALPSLERQGRAIIDAQNMVCRRCEGGVGHG